MASADARRAPYSTAPASSSAASARAARRPTPLYADVHAPNDCWAIDFKGWARAGDVARIDPLTLIDADSRFLIACEGLPRPTLAYVLPVVERAFRERGLPNAIRSDNGPPFASAGLGGLSALGRGGYGTASAAVVGGEISAYAEITILQ